MPESLTHCVVCGFPESACELARLTWREAEDTPDGWPLWLIVAKQTKANDVLVCMECIRGIKQLPFSDLPKTAGVNEAHNPPARSRACPALTDEETDDGE